MRYYPPITAKTYRFNRYLFELAIDSGERQRFLEDRERTLDARSDLEAAEKEALTDVDLKSIRKLGGHPILATVVQRVVDRYERPGENVYH